MESGQKNIYHVDEPPQLARRRNPAPVASDGLPDASRAYRRAEAGQAPRLHQDHRVRLRRRRGEHNSSALLVNKALWLVLGLVVIVYGVVLVYSTVRSRNRPAKAAAKVIVSAPVPAPQDPSAPIDYAGELAILQKARSLSEASANDLEAGKQPGALEKARQAIELAPHMAVAHREHARALHAGRDFAGAEAAWRRVLERDPGDHAARIQLAAVFLAGGQYSNALAAARWGLEQDPYSEDAHEIAAAALNALQLPQEALVHLRRLVNLDRDNLAAQNNLGIALLNLKDYRNAMNTFREVLRSDPGNSAAFYNLAITHARQQQAGQAVEVLEQAVRKFGSAFVLSWTQSKDFDPIRGDDLFARFVETGAQAGIETNAAPAREDGAAENVAVP